ncbi:MAG: hypothetical protein AB7O57_12380 [Hyphomicrobiaceae bacterium]
MQAPRAEEPIRLARAGGSLELAGRQVRCENVRMRLDRDLPNLGAAAPDERLMILNPSLLRRYSNAVQLFVFHHECGHTKVGASELAADCWAVGQGVRDGWLGRNGLAQVCRSFENAPETSTHPSGKRRCANLDRCYATAELKWSGIARLASGPVAPASSAALATRARVVRTAQTAAPTLVSGPRLLRSSYLR